MTVSGPPPDTTRAMRYQWLPILAVLTGLIFLGSLLVQRLGASGVAAPFAPPEVGVPTESGALGFSFSLPANWPAPTLRDDNSFVVSPDGSADTSTTAGPFLYVVVDALTVFSKQLAFKDNLEDPAAQLDAVIDSLNRDRARFSAAVAHSRSVYPAASTTGYERGNQLTITLMRLPDGRWVYFGAQAKTEAYPYYESTVFRPLINTFSLAAGR
jgi:hypothetical protein